jgi:hypothetical protein
MKWGVEEREDVWESGGKAPSFLTSALDAERSAQHPGRFTPLENSLRDPFYRRLVGPQSRSRGCGDEKIPWPCREFNPGRPARSPSLYPLSYPGSST